MFCKYFRQFYLIKLIDLPCILLFVYIYRFDKHLHFFIPERLSGEAVYYKPDPNICHIIVNIGNRKINIYQSFKKGKNNICIYLAGGQPSEHQKSQKISQHPAIRFSKLQI